MWSPWRNWDPAGHDGRPCPQAFRSWRTAGKHPRPRPGNVPKNRAHSGLRTPWPCQYGDNTGTSSFGPRCQHPICKCPAQRYGDGRRHQFPAGNPACTNLPRLFQRLRRLDAQDGAPAVVAVLSFFLRGLESAVKLLV